MLLAGLFIYVSFRRCAVQQLICHVDFVLVILCQHPQQEIAGMRKTVKVYSHVILHAAYVYHIVITHQVTMIHVLLTTTPPDPQRCVPWRCGGERNFLLHVLSFVGGVRVW